MRQLPCLVLIATVWLVVPCQGETPEGRAVAYLGREVPRWSRENHCFSCHNNGDAARALFAAKRARIDLPDGALDDTETWLAHPERWDENGPGADAGFSDKRLARLQFAGALAASVEAGRDRDRPALVVAAERVTADQASDGSWPIDEAGLVGTPATYGPPLATAMARRTLHDADPARFAGPIARADRWLRARTVRNVLDASAVLLTLGPDDPADADLIKRCLDLLREAQSREGGWGPYRNSPFEPFDTALALLALARWPDRPGVAALVRRGRAALIASQLDDGSWPETTRPPGAESYAQRLSTTGWATLALIQTR